MHNWFQLKYTPRGLPVSANFSSTYLGQPNKKTHPQADTPSLSYLYGRHTCSLTRKLRVIPLNIPTVYIFIRTL